MNKKSKSKLDDELQKILDEQSDYELFILLVIADRIAEIGNSAGNINKLSPNFVAKTSSDLAKIELKSKSVINSQKSNIKALLTDVAENAYTSTKSLFEKVGKVFNPFNKNKSIQKVTNTVINNCIDTYNNLCRTQAFMLRDSNGALVPTKLSEAYQKVIDKAVTTANSNLDYNKVLQDTLRQLNNSGIRNVVYTPKSGRTYSQNLYTAVKRNLLDGIRAMQQDILDEAGKQFGADGVELSVHIYPAQDHAPIQGHQFTNEEYNRLQSDTAFKDIENNKFSPIERAIGTLNCRHFSYPILVGYSTPKYTAKQLQELLDTNQKGITYGGKHLTMYECTQVQRKFEFDIRKAKQGKILAKQSGNDELVNKYRAEIIKLTNAYVDFSKSAKLSTKNNNLVVDWL